MPHFTPSDPSDRIRTAREALAWEQSQKIADDKEKEREKRELKRFIITTTISIIAATAAIIAAVASILSCLI